jgi:hypothetical protein
VAAPGIGWNFGRLPGLSEILSLKRASPPEFEIEMLDDNTGQPSIHRL